MTRGAHIPAHERNDRWEAGVEPPVPVPTVPKTAKPVAVVALVAAVAAVASVAVANLGPHPTVGRNTSNAQRSWYEKDAEWQLTAGSVDGVAISLPPADNRSRFESQHVRITLAVQSGRVSGSAGCNGYRARLKAQGAHLRITELGSTLVGCHWAEQERLFLKGLTRVTSTAYDGTQLTLIGPRAQLSFTSAGGD